MTKSSTILWLQSLFRAKGFLPGPALGPGVALVNVFALGGTLLGKTWGFFLIVNSLFLLLSLFDLVRLPARREVRCRREIRPNQERGVDFAVTLTLENAGRIPIHAALIDELPPVFQRPFPIRGTVAAGAAAKWSYTTQVALRGAYNLNTIHIRYRSFWGLWEKQTSAACPQALKVTPDLSQVKGQLARAQKVLSDYGEFTKRHQVGSGEFSQIRAYVVGDDPRKINWRQTAKMAELMTNVYLPEHGKHVALLIDCGRAMGVELSRTNRLERALEAALSLAAIALRHGDYVSVTLFSSAIRVHVPPGNRLSHLRVIIDAVYAMQSDAAESNYTQVLHYLDSVQKRQSLIIMFSDLEPFLLEETSLRYILRMQRKHLFLLLGVQDPMVQQWSEAEPGDVKESMLKSVAQKAMLTRKDRLKYWTRRGVHLLEVEQEQLAGAAVDYYIQVINRGKI